ncbi:MAG: DUF2723 domain-containing protein [Anaerolineae bacterium]|nr:DUF2723 domain-containing protein [Anaerolineae bacterium]
MQHTWPTFWNRIARQPKLTAGLGAGLFILRIGFESTAPGRLWCILAAALCLAAGFLAQRAGRSLGSLNLLWVYALWPAVSPSLATGLGLVTLVALIVEQVRWDKIPLYAIDLILFAGALALYIATLAPTILPADSGEFQIVGPLLGVAHPPGYAMFTLLARLFSMIPLGEIAWRVNLIGAFTGALTVTIVNRAARRITYSPWAGLIAAAALGVSTTFWAQSTTINIRALTILFTALCIDQLAAFVQSDQGSEPARRALRRFAISFGLGAAHHSSLLFFAPVFAITILWHDLGLLKRWREWTRYLLTFLAPFAFNLYIVIRAITGAPFGADNLVNAQRVLDHLTMRGFGGDMFAYLKLDHLLWERFLMVGNIFHFQFDWILLIIAAAGGAWLAWKGRKLALLLGGTWATMTFIVATYRAPQSVEYLMPAYVPITLCIGCAIAWILPNPQHTWLTNQFSAVFVALLIIPVLALAQANLPSYQLLHRDRNAHEYAESVLNNAPPDARILANWHWATPLWYMRLVEGKRSDVTVEYIPPQGATSMPYAWPQIITQRLEEENRPLIVTNYYPPYIDLPYRFEPLSEAFLIRDEPNLTPPDDIVRLDVDLGDQVRGGKIRLLGYRLHKAQVSPGEAVTVDLIWQPLVTLERDYSFFVHLLGPDGTPLGQHDRRHYAAPTYLPGEVLVDRYEFPTLLQAAPGQYALVAGAYLNFDDGTWQRLTTGRGEDTVRLDSIAIEPGDLSPVTLHPLRHRFVGTNQAGPTLIGVDYDDSFPGQRRVYAHWQINTEQPFGVTLFQNAQPIAHAQAPSSPAGYITLAFDVAPNADDLSIAIDGYSARGVWGLDRSRPIALPRPNAKQHYLPFGGKLALIGVDVQTRWQAGKQARVALTFLGTQPIVHDYVISVSVQGEGFALLPSDWVPALGAIPTFKWVRGSQIIDVHLIDLPADAHGEAEIALGVYDAFVNTRALSPLDERFTRLGRPTVPLQTMVIE